MSLLLSPTPSSPIPPALYPSSLSLLLHRSLCDLHPPPLLPPPCTSYPLLLPFAMPPSCRHRLITAPLLFFITLLLPQIPRPSFVFVSTAFLHTSLSSCTLPPSSAGWCFPACSDYYREHVRRFFACCDDVAPGLQSPSHTKGMSGSRGRYKDSH